MSHVIGVDLVIQDLKALADACKEHGCTFVKGQTTHKWYGSWQNDYSRNDAEYKQGIPPEMYGKCVHAITVPGAQYEIGVYNNPKGKGFVLAFDNWGLHQGEPIVNLLGSGLEKLKQSYAVCKATLEAKAKGWIVSRQTLPNGTVKLTMSGM